MALKTWIGRPQLLPEIFEIELRPIWWAAETEQPSPTSSLDACEVGFCFLLCLLISPFYTRLACHIVLCVVSCGPYNMCFCVCHEAWGDTTTCVLYLGVCVCLVFCVLYAVSCVLRGLLLVVSLLVEWRPPVQLL